MEYQDPQLQKSIGQFYSPENIQAPGTILSDVMNRVTQLDEYLVMHKPEYELLQALSSTCWEVRATALYTLGRRQEYTSLDPYITALHDKHPMVRVAAVQVLGSLGERVPLNVLVLASQDSASEVREMATLVLEEIQQQKVPSLAGVASYWSSVQQSLYHFWLVFIRQCLLLRGKSVITALILLLSYGLTILIVQGNRNIYEAVVTLGLVTTLATSVGIAFTSDPKTDVGTEIVCSTMTSLVSIMFSRFLIVIGSNMLLSMCASTVIALLYGQGPWNIIQFWLAPLFFTASLTLALVPFLGSWLSFLVMCVLEFVQTLRFGPDGGVQLLAHSYLWQTNPALLMLAVLCLLFSLLYMPRQSGRNT